LVSTKANVLLYSNTDKATDKDLLLAGKGPLPVTVDLAVMVEDSATHRLLALLPAPIPSTLPLSTTFADNEGKATTRWLTIGL
jgi:hypothetical protein